MTFVSCMLLLLPMCGVAVAHGVELLNDFSECAQQDTCSTQPAALSLLQMNVQKPPTRSKFIHLRDGLKFSLPTSYWIYGTYHKTGCELIRGMCERLTGSMPEWRGFDGEADFSHDPFTNWYYQPNITMIHGLPDYRFVHMIRDPADLIVSAYRFHTQPIEEFLQNPMNDMRFFTDQFYGYLPELMQSEYALRHNVPEAHQPLLHRFFEAVDAGKSLPEFYEVESEEDGVVIEAYRSWWQVDTMAENYEATCNDKNTLQVRMENIKDEFEVHMSCIFDFLNDAHSFDVNTAMSLVDPLNIKKYGAAASAEHDKAHIAKNIDNRELFEALKTVPFIDETNERLSKEAVRAC